MARPEPRRPDWLTITPPAALGQAILAPPLEQQRDETVRALVFPATAQRPATAAAAVSRRLAAPSASHLKPAAGAAPPPGSALEAEPAYRSALDRLLQRPATAPGTASAVRSSRAASAAPTLPSSRLDSLLAARRPAAPQQPQQSRQQFSSTSLDSLLRRPPVAAATGQRAPLPSSRLDELLARPATAAGSSSTLRPATAAGSSSTMRPSTVAAAGHGGTAAAAVGGSSSLRLTAPAAAGQYTAAAARPAALSPVDEESSPFGRQQAAVGAGAAGLAEPRPDGSSKSSRPAAVAAALDTGAAAHEAGPAAAAAPAVGPPTGAAAAVAALDPGLHDRLQQRIEEAKAQVRQQLSPMFRLSTALLGAGQDAGKAAQALDAATGLAASGFDQLAARPGSRGSGSAAGSGRPPAGQAVLLPQAGGRAWQQVPLVQLEPQQRHQQESPQQQHGQQAQEEQQAPGAWEDGGAPDLHPAFAAGTSSAEEVDSLVANARAAAARAQSAIAGLTSPPRLHTAAGSGAACATPSGSSVPRLVAPLPYAQQRREQQPAAELQLAGRGSGQLALPAGDAEAMVAHLREQSEALIRSECERLVAGMHAVLDSLLDSVQQAQRVAQQAQPQPQPQPQAQPQAGQEEEGQPTSSAAQRQEMRFSSDGPGSRDGSEVGDVCTPAGSVELVEEGSEQQAWALQPQRPEAGQPGQQQAADAAVATDDSCNVGAPFAFAAAAALQQWEGQQLDEEEQQQSGGGTPSAGSPPEARTNLGGLAGGGFGSPFKLPSQQPSPAKPAAAWRAEGQPTPDWAAQQGRAPDEQLPSVSAKSLTFAPLPAAAAGTPASQATPALLRPAGGGLDAYRTARSVASVTSSDGYGGSVSRMGSSGGGGAGAAASPGYYSSWSGGGRTPAGAAAAGLATPLLVGGASGAAGGAGGKGIDDILGSIRRLAAEMRMKQGILAAPPSTSQLVHTGAQGGLARAAADPAVASAVKPLR